MHSRNPKNNIFKCYQEEKISFFGGAPFPEFSAVNIFTCERYWRKDGFG